MEEICLKKINHWNCNSIKNKDLKLKYFLEKNKPDVLSINEIKCNEYWANTKLCFENYNVIYKCRNNHGGGVAFLIRDNIKYIESNICQIFCEEIIGFSFKCNNTSLNIFAYYNSPNQEINRDIFNYIELNCTNYLIMGDLNAKSSKHLSNNQNKNGDILEDILTSNNCQIIKDNNEPTFQIIRKESDNYGEVLDLFISKSSFNTTTLQPSQLSSSFTKIYN